MTGNFEQVAHEEAATSGPALAPAFCEPEGRTREPKSWVPAVAMVAIPLMTIAAAAFGRVGREWAVAAIFIGMFVFLLLLAIWVVPADLKGYSAAFGSALVGAALLTVALIGFTRFASNIDRNSPSPSTVTPSPGSTAPTTNGGSSTVLTPSSSTTAKP
jgi:uncharacterized membrane protein